MRLTLIPGLTLVLSACCVFSQEPKGAPSPYEFKKVHDPNGTGKFFKGREIALVMGYQAAAWLERPEREKEEQTSKLVKALKLKPEMVVADVGAGSGYLTFRMAKLLPKGKVFANDIQKEMLEILRKRAAELKAANVEPVLGTETDPKLPNSGVDLIILVDVYHEFAFPLEMTQGMIKSLKPGGKLVFVEFRGEDPEVPIKLVHKMTVKQLLHEMKDHPLKYKETIGILPWQHIVVFEKVERSQP
ncbi:MAG: class I SAM-dependent methyltransferase [Gemmataceae bacterium]|nr:class I SAM-dependent methyltransferase [Gemmataceae bacterium]